MRKDLFRILVAMDGSEPSRLGLDYIAQMLGPARSDITLFQVAGPNPDARLDFSPSGAPRIEPYDEETALEGLLPFMEKARRSLLKSGFQDDRVNLKIKPMVTGVARDILAESRQGYHLVVIGRTGGGVSNGLSLGSVAHKILANIDHVPVCVAAGRSAPGPTLLALDPSEGSLNAACLLSRVIEPDDGAVILFHAVRRPGVHFDDVKPQELAELIARIVQEDREKMIPVFSRTGDVLAAAGIKKDRVTEKTETEVTSRAWAVCREAKRHGCGSIFVGRRGMSRVEEFLIGRVSQKVVMLAEEHAVWVVP